MSRRSIASLAACALLSIRLGGWGSSAEEGFTRRREGREEIAFGGVFGGSIGFGGWGDTGRYFHTKNTKSTKVVGHVAKPLCHTDGASDIMIEGVGPLRGRPRSLGALRVLGVKYLRYGEAHASAAAISRAFGLPRHLRGFA